MSIGHQEVTREGASQFCMQQIAPIFQSGSQEEQGKPLSEFQNNMYIIGYMDGMLTTLLDQYGLPEGVDRGYVHIEIVANLLGCEQRQAGELLMDMRKREDNLTFLEGNMDGIDRVNPVNDERLAEVTYSLMHRLKQI
jgi:hypothetical protein